MKSRRRKRSGKQSICPAKADGTTHAGKGDSELAGPRAMHPKFSVPNPDASFAGPDETLLPFSKAVVYAAVEELSHASLAEGIGRATEYEAERNSPDYIGELKRWVSAYIRDCGEQAGNSITRVWIRTTPDLFREIVRAKHLGIPFFLSERPDLRIENPASAEECQESFLAMAKNPLASRERLLTQNATAIHQAALAGDVAFFGKLAQAFRSDRKRIRLGSGTAKAWVLRFWLPAGLWRLSYPKGAKRLSEALKKIRECAPQTDLPGATIIAAGCSTVEEQAYRKAVGELGLRRTN